MARDDGIQSIRTVLAPLRSGGGGRTGLRTARNINHVSLMKAGWHMISRRDDMWVEVIRSKYRCGHGSIPKINTSLSGSNFWRGICHSWDMVRDNVVWRVRSGSLINCWEEAWLPQGVSLKDNLLRPLDANEGSLRVSDLVTNGQRDLSPIDDIIIHPSVKDLILAMPPPNEGGGLDSVAWRLSNDGDFSNSLAYEALMDPSLKATSGLFKTIWRWPGHERGRLLLWKIGQDAVATNSLRWQRGIAQSSACPVCTNAEETLLHLFRDCSRVAHVWQCVYGDTLPP